MTWPECLCYPRGCRPLKSPAKEMALMASFKKTTISLNAITVYEKREQNLNFSPLRKPPARTHGKWRAAEPLGSTVTRLSAILNDADFVHDVSTVHRCPRLWTPDRIVASRDSVIFWVHGVYPVSRCPRGQGGARRFVPFGIRAQFFVSTGNGVVPKPVVYQFQI